jgi:hypothetical protein
MKDYIMYGLSGLALATGTYVPMFMALSLIHSFGEKIDSQSKLEKLTKEEFENSNKADLSIIPKYGAKRNESDFVDGNYHLFVGKGNLATRAWVRHEACHIRNEDLKHHSTLRYFLLEEPRALLYGAFKIKV